MANNREVAMGVENPEERVEGPGSEKVADQLAEVPLGSVNSKASGSLLAASQEKKDGRIGKLLKQLKAIKKSIGARKPSLRSLTAGRLKGITSKVRALKDRAKRVMNRGGRG